MTPKLTDAGKNLLLRALAGETITFTKIQLGNGPEQDPVNATALENPLMTLEIADIKVGDAYVTLTTQFSNSAVESGFHITEAGFYAADPDDDTKELLYALGNEADSTADYVPDKNDRILELQFDALIFVGDAENVSAAIGSSLVYASKEALDEHIADQANPHGVTKEQVGLDKVPNVTTEDQTPFFTEAEVLKNIESGETLSTLFGKICKAIRGLIAHIGQHDNPHGTTAAQIGAAAKSHAHNAQDINAGILPVTRGGTGCGSMEGLMDLVNSGAVVGTYTGDGSETKNINLRFKPRLVQVICATPIATSSSAREYYYWECYNGTATQEHNALAPCVVSTSKYFRSYNHCYVTVQITDTGFRVSNCHLQHDHAKTNVASYVYHYIAIR